MRKVFIVMVMIALCVMGLGSMVYKNTTANTIYTQYGPVAAGQTIQTPVYVRAPGLVLQSSSPLPIVIASGTITEDATTAHTLTQVPITVTGDLLVKIDFAEASGPVALYFDATTTSALYINNFYSAVINSAYVNSLWIETIGATTNISYSVTDMLYVK
jgi:hypothetical protein